MTDLLDAETRAELVARLRVDLADVGEAHLPHILNLTQGLDQAIRDIARHTPRQMIYEVEVKERSYTRRLYSPHYDEDLRPFPLITYAAKSVSVAGGKFEYVGLKPMRPFTEKLWSADANGDNPSGYHTRGSDYEVNYADNAFYIPVGSSAERGSSGSRRWLWCSYEVDPYIIDLGPLYLRWGFSTFGGINPIRVVRVEYPLGRTPQNYIPFDVWGELLYPHWPDFEFSDGPMQKPQARHIIIHYETDQWIWSSTQGDDIFNSLNHYAVPNQAYGDPMIILYYQMAYGLGQNFMDDDKSFYLPGFDLPKSEFMEPVIKAVKDMSRHVPLQLARDYVIDLQVDDESFSIGSEDLRNNNIDKFHQLSNGPIEPFTEAVWSAAGKSGTQYVRDTDYEMDYSNGRIGWHTKNSVASGTTLTEDTTYYISYRKNPRVIDISELGRLGGDYWLANFYETEYSPADPIRVTSVEYPVGQFPRQMIPFYVVGDNLYIDVKVFDERLLRVEYEATYRHPDFGFSWYQDEIWVIESGLLVVKSGIVTQTGTSYSITYTITITNLGMTDLTLVYVLDELGGVLPGGDITSEFSATLPAGQEESFEFTRAVEDDDPNPLVNVVNVSYTDPEGNDLEVYATYVFVRY